MRLLGTLPPAFVMLVLINVAFLGCTMMFMNAQTEQRTKLVQQIVDHCYNGK